MSADTIDLLKPLAQRHEKRERDKPARWFIHAGVAAGVVGIAGLWAIGIFTHPADTEGLHEVKPLVTIAITAGCVAVIVGALVRVLQRMQDRGQERSKRDLEKVLADAEIIRLRREYQFRADLERSHDDLGDRMAEAVGRQIPVIMGAVCRIMADDRKAADDAERKGYATGYTDALAGNGNGRALRSVRNPEDR